MPATDHLGEQYRGVHQPQADEDSPAIHNLHELFGDDVYHNPQYFGHGDKTHDREAATALRRAQGNPEAMVDVYRAVPHGVTSINTGDWVTTSPSYARQHGYHAHDESQDWPVLHAQVPAEHVRTGGNDIIEWGYSGPPIEKAKVHFRGGR
jgi:hypothetical protein